jgi:hypothetical protein
MRLVFSHAISVEPEPPNKSNIKLFFFVVLSNASLANATGFCVGCK